VTKGYLPQSKMMPPWRVLLHQHGTPVAPPGYQFTDTDLVVHLSPHGTDPGAALAQLSGIPANSLRPVVTMDERVTDVDVMEQALDALPGELSGPAPLYPMGRVPTADQVLGWLRMRRGRGDDGPVLVRLDERDQMSDEDKARLAPLEELGRILYPDLAAQFAVYVLN